MSAFSEEDYEEMRDHFGHDDCDNTYGLTAWFSPEETEAIIDFCLKNNICPITLMEYGMSAIIQASISSDGLAVVLRIPPCN